MVWGSTFSSSLVGNEHVQLPSMQLSSDWNEVSQAAEREKKKIQPGFQKNKKPQWLNVIFQWEANKSWLTQVLR